MPSIEAFIGATFWYKGGFKSSSILETIMIIVMSNLTKDLSGTDKVCPKLPGPKAPLTKKSTILAIFWYAWHTQKSMGAAKARLRSG